MRRPCVVRGTAEAVSGKHSAGVGRSGRSASMAARSRWRGHGWASAAVRRGVCRVGSGGGGGGGGVRRGGGGGVGEDWLGRWAMTLMRLGVSARRFGRAVRLPEGDV